MSLSGKIASGSETYGTRRVKSSLYHFILGRFASAAFGFVITILIVRMLPTDQYAAYAVMLGLVEATAMVSSLGLNLSVQRFLPELRVEDRGRQLFDVTVAILVIRVLMLAVFVGLIHVAIQTIAEWFKLQDFIFELRCWSIAIFVMAMFRLMGFILESLLLQKLTKWLLLLLSVLRFLALCSFMYFSDEFTLMSVIWLESAAYLVVTTIAFQSLMVHLRKVRKARGNTEKDPAFLRRFVKFSMFNYFTNINELLGGSATNRLVIAALLSQLQIATFGFAQSISDMLKRYTPTFLLHKMLQPVLFARFTKNKDYRSLSKAGNCIFKINAFILGPPLIAVTVLNNDLAGLLTGGRYPEAGWVIVMLMLIQFIENYTYPLVLLANAAEANEHNLISTLFSSLSIVLAFLLVPRLGIGGLVLARAIGTFISAAYLSIVVKMKKIPFSFDWPGFVRMVLSYVISVAILWFFRHSNMGWPHMVVSFMVGSVLFVLVAFLIKPFKQDERDLINEMLGRRVFVW